jgi:hypothetical protein
MLMEREPSRPAHFEYGPMFGARTASCSTVLRGEPSQRKTPKWRAFADGRIRPPGRPDLKGASISIFLTPS